jgi:chromosome segregation ATPase
MGAERRRRETVTSPTPGNERKVRQLDNDVQAIYELIARIEVTQRRHTTRFDGLDSQILAMDSRLDGIETRLDGIDTRLGELGTKLDEILIRMPVPAGRA